jgi:hypothetical protein
VDGTRTVRRVGGRVLTALLTLSVGCTSIRLYAKELMHPDVSPAVSVPVQIAVALFVLPPAIAWLPISMVPLLAFHNEAAVWFALAPGLIVGGPIVLLAGTPGYVLTDRAEDIAPVASSP